MQEQKKIILSPTPEQHAALMADADADTRKIGQHTLHRALQHPSVAKRLTSLLKRKATASKHPAARKGAKGV